ncbi:unnamed protein product [Leuciscus chuanchicus]
MAAGYRYKSGVRKGTKDWKPKRKKPDSLKALGSSVSPESAANTWKKLILPPFFSSCLAAFSVQYVPCTPPDILPPWGNPASTTHTQPFPSVPAEILASRTSNGSALSARIRTAAQAAFPRSAAPFLPLDFTDSQLAELKRAQVIHSDSFPPPPRSLSIILRQARLGRTFSGRFVVTAWGKCKRSHHSVAATR